MILTEAKKRARSEFEEVLWKTGLTADAARSRLDADPAPSKRPIECRTRAGSAPRPTWSPIWRSRTTTLFVGIDVGSTTVKAMMLENDEILWRDYQRHNTRQAERVSECPWTLMILS